MINPALDELVPLTRALVRAPSPNPPGDERAAAAVVEEFLAGVPGVAKRTFASREERPNLVFSYGAGERCLLLSAHLDTHPVATGWSYDPFAAEIADDRIYGLGTTDNKGAVAAMAVVFRQLAEQGAPGRVLFVANADEETGGAEGIAVVLEGLDEPVSAVVVAEPSGIFGSFEKLWIAARGTSRFRLRAAAAETHSSLADSDGVDNAIEVLDAAVRTLRDGLTVEGRLIPVEVRGGRGWGAIPARAEISLELRVSPPAEQSAVEQAVALLLEPAPVELEHADGSLRWMAPSSVSEGSPLVRVGRLAWRDVFGREPELGCFPGGTDARLFSERGIPTLSGVGPGALVRAHHADEYVTVDELRDAARLYSSLVARYFE